VSHFGPSYRARRSKQGMSEADARTDDRPAEFLEGYRDLS
jgi:hypothetical protein